MRRFFGLVLFALCMIPLAAFAAPKRGIDSKRIGEDFDDALAEVGAPKDEASERLTLRFFNALDGKPISGGQVTIAGFAEPFTTDGEGKVLFPIPEEDGKKKVVFAREGYVTSEFEIEIEVHSLFFNRFSVSPSLDKEYVRIVLDWDAKPADLDGHLVKLGADGYHVSYRDMTTSKDGAAHLDRDDLDGYGPETITITRVDGAATYEYLVHDFSNAGNKQDKELGKSKATVKVYAQARLVGVYQVPRDSTGNFWRVFAIEKGQIKLLGEMIGR